MEYELHSHRNALEVVSNVPGYMDLWKDITESLKSITEERVIDHFQSNFEFHGSPTKSLSKTINSLLREELTTRGWESESRIFGEPSYSPNKQDKKWRLDFSKNVPNSSRDEIDRSLEPTVGISVEVAFNHDGTTAWNLIKPVLAGELNHVKKELQTGLGVIITATEGLKASGGFDAAIGSFDDFKLHLRPMRNLLTVPLLIIGLEAFKTFKMDVEKRGNQSFGKIVRL